MLLLSATSPTIFEGSDHDADVGCRRGILPTRQLPCNGRADEGEQIRDLRDHIRHCIPTPVYGLRATQLAAFHLSSGTRQRGFLEAASRGRPAHVLVWLGRGRPPPRGR